ncbi:HAD family hydrolase [Lederbergia wuyishanensis]|uniref:Phosphoglycolate phosphatase-like HAD superfamily hydrolase n=1 Tax=Lederbergia wuyishanensis TaxID=1347903 RepID=A0ABU0D415_9BACI|nr:HAD hydrolase-like protein [Lederbergia wuyishanensis]MCJ8008284.1 HAD hydrolase-like protein [Lederbergia wuyishanensis]MDQ0343125.1 phosphoglycolate phosphatase-like HAD superfamily hydrolase [Lederbergia wuyishanensis]
MIKTVLFDVDGVLLSEERYFDASALTVWEILYSKNYLGLNPEKFKTDYSDSEIDEIRARVFEHDLVLKFQKSCGLNANWDMIYLTVAYQIIRLLEQVKDSKQVAQWVSNEMNRDVLLEIGAALAGKELSLDFSAFLDDFEQSERTKVGLFSHLDDLAKEKLGVEKSVFGEIGELWSTCELVSQEWYVGDKHVFASTGRPSVQTGKKGFLSVEKVLAPAEEIASLFESLKKAGVTIGIGTGRPELETLEPFKYLEWLKHFDVNYIVTADDVLAAERNIPEATPLSKPNPFTYVKALSGKTKTDQECIEEEMPIPNGKETLIVGDSFADLLAARKMGCTFAAVLTGLSGKDARADFEKHNAEYILDSVLDVKDLVLSLVK